MPSDQTSEGRGAQDGESADPRLPTDQPPTATVHEYAERIRQEQLGEAIDSLEARGDLTTAQREVVEQMTVRIVCGMLARPTAALESGPAGDAAVRRAVRRLFVESSADERW